MGTELPIPSAKLDHWLVYPNSAKQEILKRTHVLRSELLELRIGAVATDCSVKLRRGR